MGLRAEHGYNFTVTSGNLMQSRKGTHGFQIFLECDEGTTEFTIWLTDGNRNNALDAFKALGVSQRDLASRGFVEHQLPQAIVGRMVYGWMKAEEYNGKSRIKVDWIGAK